MKPAGSSPYPVCSSEPRPTETRSTAQYATVTQPATIKSVFLHVIPVKITSPDGRFITTYGLLDNASHGTMISQDVANELGLKGRKEVISVSTLLQQEEEKFEVVEFTLQKEKFLLLQRD